MNLAHGVLWRSPTCNFPYFALRVEPPGSFHTFPVHDGGNHQGYKNDEHDAAHANPKYCQWMFLKRSVRNEILSTKKLNKEL